MLESSRLAVLGLTDRPREEFERDRFLILAITKLVEIVGEASKNISPELRGAHPEVARREIAGTRDKLVHAYSSVDLNFLWDIVHRDLPRLIPALEAISYELRP